MKFIHKLEYLIFEILDKQEKIDVTDLSHYLCACTSPSKGVKAYRIVAADILEAATNGERLIRHGNGDNKSPERGGFYYTKSLTNN